MDQGEKMSTLPEHFDIKITTSPIGVTFEAKNLSGQKLFKGFAKLEGSEWAIKWTAYNTKKKGPWSELVSQTVEHRRQFKTRRRVIRYFMDMVTSMGKGGIW
jgi:hypothetical protein